jgi:hypothetical protein
LGSKKPFLGGVGLSPPYLIRFLREIMSNKQNIHDININFDENTEGLVIEKSQAIPDEWLQTLKNERFESKNKRTGEYHRAASIPVAVHELWLTQGYDMTKEPIKKTLAKLKAEGLDAFITSDKAF